MILTPARYAFVSSVLYQKYSIISCNKLQDTRKRSHTRKYIFIRIEWIFLRHRFRGTNKLTPYPEILVFVTFLSGKLQFNPFIRPVKPRF